MILHQDYNKTARSLALTIDQYADADAPFDILLRFDGKRAHAEFVHGCDAEFSCCKREQELIGIQEASKRPQVG